MAKPINVTVLSLLTAIFVAGPGAGAQAKKRELKVVGFAECAVINPGGLRLPAKMDTGAFSTSLHAPNFKRFTRDDKEWIRMTMRFDGKEQTVERPIVRIAKVRRARVGVRERPVIRLNICVGEYCKDAQVNLTNRGRMKYPLLIGRRFMASAGLAIASDRQYRADRTCRKPTKRAK